MSDLDECWLHEGADNGRGYQRLWIDGRLQYLHVWSWEEWNGREVRDGFEIDHLCCVVNCWNPTHLEEVTHAENMRRKHEKITHCTQGHEFTDDNTRIDPKTGKRHCRACCRIRSQQHRQRRSQEPRRAARVA